MHDLYSLDCRFVLYYAIMEVLNGGMVLRLMSVGKLTVVMKIQNNSGPLS